MGREDGGAAGVCVQQCSGQGACACACALSQSASQSATRSAHEITLPFLSLPCPSLPFPSLDSHLFRLRRLRRSEGKGKIKRTANKEQKRKSETISWSWPQRQPQRRTVERGKESVRCVRWRRARRAQRHTDGHAATNDGRSWRQAEARWTADASVHPTGRVEWADVHFCASAHSNQPHHCVLWRSHPPPLAAPWRCSRRAHWTDSSGSSAPPLRARRIRPPL